jgi:hypothetical protein
VWNRLHGEGDAGDALADFVVDADRVREVAGLMGWEPGAMTPPSAYLLGRWTTHWMLPRWELAASPGAIADEITTIRRAWRERAPTLSPWGRTYGETLVQAIERHLAGRILPTLPGAPLGLVAESWASAGTWEEVEHVATQWEAGAFRLQVPPAMRALQEVGRRRIGYALDTRVLGRLLPWVADQLGDTSVPMRATALRASWHQILTAFEADGARWEATPTARGIAARVLPVAWLSQVADLVIPMNMAAEPVRAWETW